jgi:hypothetical protein
MGVKYKMQWTNAQNDLCVLNFIVDDAVYSGQPITIYGGPRPFVLSEFNTDNDLFKPVRAQQATIEVLASINGVDIEDFIVEDDDQQIKVRFDYGPWTGYWYGILSQEDMSEIWIAQNHILTLRADEGFGAMKNIPLADYQGNILAGTITPFTLIQYATSETVLSFFQCFVFSNLFHDSMNDAFEETGLDQCMIDTRTFETSPGVFEDSYTVLEKINSAFNQCIFQYRGKWVILRIEELFIPPTENLIGFQQNRPTVIDRLGIATRYNIEVGANKDVKPIMPEMIRTLNKPSKNTTVTYNWDNKVQIVCNEKFKYGQFLRIDGTAPNETWNYTVDSWFHEQGTYIDRETCDKIFERRVVYTENGIDDEYIVLEKNPEKAVWIRSCDTYVSASDEMSFQIEWSLKSNATFTVSRFIGHVLLFGNDNTYWTLDDDGKWYQSNSSWTVNFRALQVSFINGEGEDWYQYPQNISIIPRDGFIQVWILSDVLSEKNFIYYRNLQIDIVPAINKYRRIKILGDYNKYTIDKSLKKNSDYQIFLDDSINPNFKGTILETDGVTRTDNNWYRRRYDTERFKFKRQNAIANWWINNKYRTRLECNFFGLKWKKDGGFSPIGLINTINFVDDVPWKTFAIVNLKEVDFMNCTWSANLIEVWDENTDTDVVPGADDVHLNDYYYES